MLFHGFHFVNTGTQVLPEAAQSPGVPSFNQILPQRGPALFAKYQPLTITLR